MDMIPIADIFRMQGFMVNITIAKGSYKPTYNILGAPPCDGIRWLLIFIVMIEDTSTIDYNVWIPLGISSIKWGISTG